MPRLYEKIRKRRGKEKMSDEKERNPILDLKDIPLLGHPIKECLSNPI